MKARINKISKKIYDFLRVLFADVSVKYFLCAMVTVCFAEILHVGFSGGISYAFRHPVAFTSAVLSVLFTYSISLMVKKRLGVFILIELFWIAFAVANSILLTFRINPLSAVDFSIILSVFSIIGVYLSPLEIVLIVCSIAVALGLCIFLIIRIPGKKVDYKKSAVRLIGAGVIAFGVFFFSTYGYAESMKGMNLPDVYREYGFVYSFSLSFIDRGISRPDDYSRVDIDNIISPENSETETEDTIESDTQSEESQTASTETWTDASVDEPEELAKPNILFIQLESFIDPAKIMGLHTSENPIPNFTYVRENYPSGLLTVPVAGAGTVNTEFEVLCGLPISVFGLGEYPYETYLREAPCESMPYYLRGSGYTSHALHNHTGTFYDRNNVMRNLGFDTFTPIEHMNGVKTNILGWACDSVLADEVIGAMESTEGPDFVYAISVQAHGKYVSVAGDYGNIDVFGDFNDNLINSLDYYVNQIYETDVFIGELLAYLNTLEEDTVAVFFGDHQPSIDITEDAMGYPSVYTTEYVIWNNMGLDVVHSDKSSYELSSYVFDMIGEEGGVVTRFYEKNEGDVSFDKLQTLAYDILFGERYAYGGTFPYQVPDMQYGWREISVDSAFIKNGVLYVFGENFTNYSKIFIDNKKRDTIFVSDELLICSGITEGESVTVSQVSDSGYVTGQAEAEISSGTDADFEIRLEE